jgi:hypothetical protein
MKRILDIRIVRWYFKLAYVVGLWLVGFPVSALFNVLRLPLAGYLANTAVTLAGILLGARVFRGRDEPVTPRRPWWQMTARPLLSRVLGIIFLMTVISTLIVYVLAAQGDARALHSLRHSTIADDVINGLLLAAIAILYLNSAARLGKLPKRVREPKFKPYLKVR